MPAGSHTITGDYAGNAGGSYHGTSRAVCPKCGTESEVEGMHYPRAGASGTVHYQVMGAMPCLPQCYAAHPKVLKAGKTKYSLAR
jgi:hypothetical protein